MNPIPLDAVVCIDNNIRIQQKSWFAGDLPQLLPTNVRDALPVPYCLENLRFCPLLMRRGTMHSPEDEFRPFLFTHKHIAGRGTRDYHSFLCVGRQCHLWDNPTFGQAVNWDPFAKASTFALGLRRDKPARHMDN